MSVLMQATRASILCLHSALDFCTVSRISCQWSCPYCVNLLRAVDASTNILFSLRPLKASLEHRQTWR